jgi:hypothetical protein
MSKEKIRDTNFRPAALARIEQLSDIVDEYQQQGLRLTARQLYYQLVARDIIANSIAEYKKLTSLLTDARYAGMIDWAAIEDRNREPNTPSEWDDPAQLVESALRAYRLPRWEGQPKYVELWVEKAALAGVLEPLAREFHATLMVNRGYSSASAMYESAERIKNNTMKDKERFDEIVAAVGEAAEEYGSGSPEQKKVIRELLPDYEKACRTAVVLYLGDHDPSGEDMVRDIEVRLKEFGVHRLEVEKVGLTIAQVKQYNPPPNPAKITDSRAKAYIEKFGNSSWEVDALPPNVLAQLIRRAFSKHVNKAKMDEIKKREETDKELLRKAVAGMMKRRDQ